MRFFVSSVLSEQKCYEKFSPSTFLYVATSLSNQIEWWWILKPVYLLCFCLLWLPRPSTPPLFPTTTTEKPGERRINELLGNFDGFLINCKIEKEENNNNILYSEMCQIFLCKIHVNLYILLLIISCKQPNTNGQANLSSFALKGRNLCDGPFLHRKIKAISKRPYIWWWDKIEGQKSGHGIFKTYIYYCTPLHGG